jgi:hypothetical protein
LPGFLYRHLSQLGHAHNLLLSYSRKQLKNP